MESVYTHTYVHAPMESVYTRTHSNGVNLHNTYVHAPMESVYTRHTPMEIHVCSNGVSTLNMYTLQWSQLTGHYTFRTLHMYTLQQWDDH